MFSKNRTEKKFFFSDGNYWCWSPRKWLFIITNVWYMYARRKRTKYDEI